MKKILLLVAYLLFTHNSFAAGTPLVSSLANGTITSNSAAISFSVVANGAQTSVWVQYNTDPVNINTGPSFTLGTVTANSFANYNPTITGLQPNTLYYWRVAATNIYGTTNTIMTSFTTLANAAIPTISGINSAPFANSATISYSLNANTSATTSIVKYGLTNSNLTNQVSGFSASGTTTTGGTASITGLTPNTQYYYQITATNSLGVSNSTIGTFTTTSPIIPQLIAEYDFNNTYNNSNGNTPFSANAGTSFVNDRQGNPNNAININQNSTSASIVGLPASNNPRSISIWAKLNNFSIFGYNHLYGYGTAGNSTGNGGSLLGSNIVNGNATTTSIGHLGYSNNHLQSVTGYDFKNWNHFIFVYDGSISKVYINGTLAGSTPKTWNTIVTANTFTLGGFFGENYFDGSLDDLKIYNFAVTDSEATSLYNNNSLATTNQITKNQRVIIYPNPAKEAFTIDMENEVKSIEIYTFQGQKVMTAVQKNVSISNLQSGIYLVRIESVNSEVSTQKLIIQ